MGAEKIFGEAQINFTLIFGREDQKKIFILAVYVFSGHKTRSREIMGGGAVYCLAGRGSRFLPTNSGVKTKQKRFWCESLGSVLALTRVLRPETKLYSRLGGGGTSSILGGHRPQNVLQWHRACYFLSGHTSRLGGSSSDLGETRPRNASQCAGTGACLSLSSHVVNIL